MIQATLYTRPHGTKQLINIAYVAPEDARIINEHGLIISVEELPSQQVVVYLRHPDWKEEDELVVIDNGENSKPSLAKIVAQYKTAHARFLTNKGYRKTSNTHRIISRIDREDWQDYCRKKGHPVCAEWYIRCLTTDKQERVHPDIFKLIPSASGYKV